MQPASEKCSYLEECSSKEDSPKENQFWFNQKQDGPAQKLCGQSTCTEHDQPAQHRET